MTDTMQLPSEDALVICAAEYPMNKHVLFPISRSEEQIHLAERELSSFIAAVTQLYGPEQATLSAQDWLEECELMVSPAQSEAQEWREVTIAAAARLASRVNSTPLSDEIARPFKN